MKYTHITIRLPASLLAAAFEKVRQGELSLSQLINEYLEAYTASEPSQHVEDITNRRGV